MFFKTLLFSATTENEPVKAAIPIRISIKYFL